MAGTTSTGTKTVPLHPRPTGGCSGGAEPRGATEAHDRADTAWAFTEEVVGRKIKKNAAVVREIMLGPAAF
jgi:hypothetical protein